MAVFFLKLRATAGGVAVSGTRTDAGADTPLPEATLPPMDPALADLVDRFLASAADDPPDPGEPDLLESVGKALYAWLDVPNRVDRDRYRVLLDADFSDMPQGTDAERAIARRYAAIPWEAMVDPKDRLPLFADPERTWMRWKRPADDEQNGLGRQSWPARVLLVLGTDPNDPSVDGGEERRAVELFCLGAVEALRFRRSDLDVHVLVRPTLQALADEMRASSPEILHIVGHGTTAAPGEPAVLDIAGWPLGQPEVAQLLVGSKRPRLVILNTCWSGSGGAYAGLPEVLHRRGVPLVLSMTWRIQPDHAITLISSIYQGITSLPPRPLDVAVAEGRAGIRLAGTGLHRGLVCPVLSVTRLPEEVLEIGRVDGRRDPVQFVQSWLPPGTFVDRIEHRRRVGSHLQTGGLVVLRGGEKDGKSWTLGVIAEGALLRGWSVRWVDLQEEPPTTLVDLLWRIGGWDGEEDAPDALSPPLPRAAFADFFAQVSKIWGGDPGELPASTDESAATVSTTQLKAVSRLFGVGLKAAAAASPLVVLLDHVDEVSPVQILERLAREVVPILRTADSHARLVIAVRPETIDRIPNAFDLATGGLVPLDEAMDADMIELVLRQWVTRVTWEVKDADERRLMEQEYREIFNGVVRKAKLLGRRISARLLFCEFDELLRGSP